MKKVFLVCYSLFFWGAAVHADEGALTREVIVHVEKTILKEHKKYLKEKDTLSFGQTMNKYKRLVSWSNQLRWAKQQLQVKKLRIEHDAQCILLKFRKPVLLQEIMKVFKDVSYTGPVIDMTGADAESFLAMREVLLGN